MLQQNTKDLIFRRIKHYVGLFYSAVEKHQEPIPAQSCYEFLNTLTHLTLLNEKDHSAQEEELKRAERHIIRCVLDYYKFIVLVSHESPHASLATISYILQVRLIEFQNIGSNHDKSIKAYSELAGTLRQSSGAMASPTSTLSASKDPEFIKLFKEFAQLEVIYSTLIQAKSEWCLGKLIALYCSSSTIHDDLAKLNIELKEEINEILVDRYKKEIQNRLFSLGKRDDLAILTILSDKNKKTEKIFSLLCLALDIKIVPYSPRKY